MKEKELQLKHQHRMFHSLAIHLTVMAVLLTIRVRKTRDTIKRWIGFPPRQNGSQVVFVRPMHKNYAAQGRPTQVVPVSSI